MIIDDYAAIARRLAQLKVKQEAFVTPDRVHIILSSRYPMVSLYAVPPECQLCLWLDEDGACLMLLPEASSETLNTAAGKRFVSYLTAHCPSAQSESAFELHLSQTDSRYLAEQVGKERQ